MAECFFRFLAPALLHFSVAEVRPGERGVGVCGEELAVLGRGRRVVALLLERHSGADRAGDDVARADQDRGVASAGPRFFQALERRPARTLIAELRADQAAIGIEAVEDDVVEEVVLAAEGVDHLQHEDGRVAVAKLARDRLAIAGDELRVEALAPRGEQHVDGQYAAAHFRERRVPGLERRRVAVMLENGGERARAAGDDAPFEERHVGDDLGGGAGALRTWSHAHARGEEKAEKESGEHGARPILVPRFDHDSAMTSTSAASAPRPTQIHSCCVRPAACSWLRF